MAREELMPPGMAALSLIDEARKKVQNPDDRYAVHHQAEAEAWKGWENYGKWNQDQGNYFGRIATIIGNLYHGDQTVDQVTGTARA